MKPIHYILLTVAAIILIAVALNWEKFKSLFTATTPPVEKSEYEKCVDKNKSLADGADCTNCLDTSSQFAGVLFNGKIKNGVCEQIQAPPREVKTGYKLKVTKPTGGFIYTMNADGSIVASQNGNTIPFDTVVIANEYITAPAPHYHVRTGWLDANDVTLVEKVNLV